MNESKVYGPHTDTVLSVMAFLRSEKLLKPRLGATTLEDPGIFVIRTLDGIKQYREPPSIDPNDEDAMLDPPPSPPLWVDILGMDSPQFYSDRKELIGDGLTVYIDNLDRLRAEVYPTIQPQLLGRIPRYEIEEIVGHFWLILDFVSVYGEHRDDLPHRLYRVYLSGGYPCGWRGWFPQGQLVVYCAS